VRVAGDVAECGAPGGGADEAYVARVPTPHVAAADQLGQSPPSLLVLRQEVDAVNVELEVPAGRTAHTGAAAAAVGRHRCCVGVDILTLSAPTLATAADSHSMDADYTTVRHKLLCIAYIRVIRLRDTTKNCLWPTCNSAPCQSGTVKSHALLGTCPLIHQPELFFASNPNPRNAN